LAGTFGLQGLIGKTVALVSDARFHGDSVPILVERLLCISGEDAISIDRKFLAAVTMRLPTRFVFLTNELPQFRDSSAALAGRFLILRLTHSFYGGEDHTLTPRLQRELPGILLWAVEGLRRLRARGRFLVPRCSEEAVQDLEDLASPIGAFVRERCVVAAGQRVDLDDLFRTWAVWGAKQGREFHGDKQRFGRDLSAAVPGVKRRRGTHTSFYEGIGLREEIPP
jgi:putative DNA primase/helicase